MDGSTALAVLGLEPGATKQQIKTTFRALAKRAHPDAFEGAVETTAAFVELRAAYERALVDAPESALTQDAAIDDGLALEAPVRSRTGGAWFTASRASVGIDITDVAVAAADSLRSSMIVRPPQVIDPAEELFASLLADELANA